MSDTNKLAELIKKAKTKMRGKTFYSDLERNMFVADCLLANGVIVPPCKVGDKVYIITLDKTVEEYTVNGVCQYTNGIFVELIDFNHIFDIPAHKVFLTKEKAVEKLKELGK